MFKLVHIQIHFQLHNSQLKVGGVIIKRIKWVTQKSIEAEEKWVLKKEEPEKKIKKNNLKWNM